MDDVKDFFSDLFATDLWPARWNCGYWSPFHGWLYIISDLIIWFAYFAIPVIILSYIYKKKFELKYTRTYFLFASFILLCGSTHLLDASMFWTPMYRFNAIIRFITALTSIATVYHLLRILPDAFRTKTSLVLEREIAKRIEAERRLAEANEGLQSFAWMASHDLQEPVRKIKLFTTQLAEENAGKLDEKSYEWIDKTLRASDRMERMIRDILGLSSINEDVEFGQADLQQAVKDALVDLEVKVNEKDAIVRTGPLPSIEGNHTYLVQLFYNLVGNALKFTERRPEVDINAKESETSVIISVKDNGIGMEPEHTEKIFQAFQRLHPRQRYEGSGIGLAIVKKIIDVHKGSVTVQSRPGEGTIFVIELPKRRV